ncbi:MAG: hypothetical protein OR993_06115 [Candidatus Poseidoniales archaeon]|nr:hypothetical protein [Candidatus Poseidoniales archaeon]
MTDSWGGRLDDDDWVTEPLGFDVPCEYREAPAYTSEGSSIALG